MTQSKHTPGPWYMAFPDTIRGQEPRIREFMHAVRDDKTGKEICVLTRVSTPKEQLQANAELIAAAPDLLEAAIIGLGYVESEEGSDTTDSDFIKAAIEKARGDHG